MQYERKDAFEPDWKEKLGNITLGALRTACGKKVIITYRGEYIPYYANTKEKIIAVAILVLLSPLYIIAIPVGVVATLLSSTYGKNMPFKPYIPANDSPPPSPPASPEAPKNDSPPKPQSPKPLVNKEEPLKERPKFGLTDDEIAQINKGENQPLNARFKTVEEVTAYIAAYKDKMDVLWLTELDLTQEKDLFGNHRFKSVHLSNCKISPLQASLLSFSMSLKEIKLTNGTFTHEVSNYISFYHADKIDLSNNNLGDSAALNKLGSNFLMPVELNLMPVELNLSGNQLTDSIMGIFNDNFTRNLKSLNLSNNQITDQGLAKTASFIKQLKNGLDLSNNLITSNGVEELAKSNDISDIVKLKVLSESFDESSFRAVLIKAAAKNNSSKAFLLQAGYSINELGITTASQLSSVLYFCYSLVTLDASGLDLSHPDSVNTIINNRSVLTLKGNEVDMEYLKLMKSIEGKEISPKIILN